MNLLNADWSPIANLIAGLGNTAAENALWKQKLARQNGKDMYEAERTKSLTDLNNAKTAQQLFETGNAQKMAGLFDPSQYTAQQKSALGAGAMLGQKSLNDIMKGALSQQSMNMQANEYANAKNPYARMSVALGKEISPYHFDSKLGVTVDQMTGNVLRNSGTEGLAINQALIKANAKPWEFDSTTGAMVNKATGQQVFNPQAVEHARAMANIRYKPFSLNDTLGAVVNQATGQTTLDPEITQRADEVNAQRYKPYQITDAGGTFNRATGAYSSNESALNDLIKLAAAKADSKEHAKAKAGTSTTTRTTSTRIGGTSKDFTPSAIKEIFSTQERIHDDFRGDKTLSIVDEEGLKNYFAFSAENNIPITPTNAVKFRNGILQREVSAQQKPTETTAENPRGPFPEFGTPPASKGITGGSNTVAPSPQTAQAQPTAPEVQPQEVQTPDRVAQSIAAVPDVLFAQNGGKPLTEGDLNRRIDEIVKHTNRKDPESVAKAEEEIEALTRLWQASKLMNKGYMPDPDGY